MKHTSLTDEQLSTLKAAFPMDMPVKIILLDNDTESVKNDLAALFRSLLIVPKSWGEKTSSGAKYRVFTIMMYMSDYDEMIKMYDHIRKVEGVVQVM